MLQFEELVREGRVAPDLLHETVGELLPLVDDITMATYDAATTGRSTAPGRRT